MQPKEEAKKPQAKGGEINFKRNGPPMFTKKKGIGLAQEEFPELGDMGAPGSKSGATGSETSGSKANSSTIGQFGAMAQQRDGG